MPIVINEIGNQYGYLTVIRRDETKVGRKYWICKCDLCGKEYSFSGTALRKNPQYFDCPTCEKIGQKYGKLIVIEYAYTASDRHKYWKCQCECGNYEIIKASDLNNNKKTECLNCRKEKYKRQYVDEVGNRYGKLIVLELDNKIKSKNAYWKCKCDCGTFLSVEGSKLRNQHTQSCGCINSKGELKISQLLTEANIIFKKEIAFKNCLNEKQLRFDFGIYDNNDNLLYLIEFDGIQHFNFTDRGWNNEQSYLNTIKRDSIKNNYCLTNNIPLIRIPYYHLKDLTINDLLLSTSNFIYKELKDEKTESCNIT